jgi:type 1 glutamine amidotransferase
VSTDLDAYLSESLGAFDLIVQCVTMSKITGEQWQGLHKAIRQGTGFAGWHGGIIDSFRDNTDYQWLTGGQWVAHPGNCIGEYDVVITKDHPITQGITSFRLTDTEQYYVHVDPANEVLCTTTFSGTHGETDLYKGGTVMPYAWTKTWGKGRVFVACWGHTFKDFEVPEAREIVRRGMLWAAR